MLGEGGGGGGVLERGVEVGDVGRKRCGGGC